MPMNELDAMDYTATIEDRLYAEAIEKGCFDEQADEINGFPVYTWEEPELI